MSASVKNSVLLTEQNWNEIISNIEVFPFRVSEITRLNREITLSQVSFKYNIEGRETYYNGSKELTLQTGEYLIAANQSYGEVSIDQQGRQDIGVCIDINIDVLQQGLQTSLFPDTYFSTAEKCAYFIEDDFFIKYKSNREFHRYLLALYHQVKSGDFYSLQELEYEFVRQFIFHQLPHLMAYKRLPVLKKSTRNELYSKMMQARNHIQDSLYSNMPVGEIAKELYISEFRFYHLFKETFQVSPHRYMLQLKMNEALLLFGSGQHTWTEIADLLKFADLQSFSKMFKKQYRMSPKQYALSGEQIRSRC
jgi:AraC-like DNA-binding protein